MLYRSINHLKYCLLIPALGVLVSCGGGGGGTNNGGGGNKPTIPQGTTSLGTLPDGAIIYISKSEFQLSPTGTTKGVIGITNADSGQPDYQGTVSFSTSIHPSSKQKSIATNTDPVLTSTPNPCALNSAQPQKICAITIHGNNANTNLYTVTPTTTSTQQVKATLSDFLINVTGTPSNKHLTLTQINWLPQGKRALLTVTANGAFGSQAPVTVNFISSNATAIHLSNDTCTINFANNNQCSIFITAGNDVGSNSTINATANNYTGVAESISVNPSFFYTLNNGNGTVSEFHFDTESGIITPIGQFPTLTDNISAATYIANGSFGRFIYALIDPNNIGSIYGLSVNPTTGKLTALANQPQNLTDESGNNVIPQTMAIAPSGKFAYIAGQNTKQTPLLLIYARSITSGKLTRLVKAMQIASLPNQITLDKTGTYMYSVSANKVNMYSINQISGLLSPLEPQTITTPSFNTLNDIVTTENNNVYVSAQNTVSGGSGSIYMYSIGSNGILQPLAPESSIAATGSPTKITFSPLGYLYGLNVLGAKMNLYTVGNNGTLSVITSQPSFMVNTPAGIKSSPFGKFVLVLDQHNNKVIEYSVQNNQGGTLKLNESATTGNNPMGLTFN